MYMYLYNICVYICIYIYIYIYIYLCTKCYQQQLLKYRRSIFAEKKDSQGVISNT